MSRAEYIKKANQVRELLKGTTFFLVFTEKDEQERVIAATTWTQPEQDLEEGIANLIATDKQFRWLIADAWERGMMKLHKSRLKKI